MAYYNTFISERESKNTFHKLSNKQGDANFIGELDKMSKKTVYFLMFSGVPKELIPIVLQKASTYSVEDVKRDLYKKTKKANTCIICGSDKDLTLHHIKPIKDFPELKYRFDNLKVICKKCHENLHYWED